MQFNIERAIKVAVDHELCSDKILKIGFVHLAATHLAGRLGLNLWIRAIPDHCGAVAAFQGRRPQGGVPFCPQADHRQSMP